jgi:hypothetical protein
MAELYTKYKAVMPKQIDPLLKFWAVLWFTINIFYPIKYSIAGTLIRENSVVMNTPLAASFSSFI